VRIERHAAGRPDFDVSVAFFLVAVSAWSTFARFRLLSSSELPIGIDGYYYAVQVRSVLQHGALRFSDAPLAFWYLATFSAIWGPFVGVKIGAALGCAAMAPAMFLLARHVTTSTLAALCAASICAFGAGSFLLSAEFVKNGLSLTLWALASWLILRAEQHTSVGTASVALVAAAVAALTHTMAFGFLMLPVAACGLGRWAGALNSERLRDATPWVALFAALSAICAGAAAAPRLLARPAAWQLPALVAGGATLKLGYEPLLAAMASAGALAVLSKSPRWSRARPTHRVFVCLSCATGLVIAFPWLNVADPNGLGFRLRIVAFLPLALNAAVVVGALVHRFGAAPRTGLLRFALPTAICTVMSSNPSEGIVRAQPAMASAVAKAGTFIETGQTVVVCERQLAFMAAWYTKASIALTSPGASGTWHWRLLTLTCIGPGSALEQALDDARAQPRLIPPLGLHEAHPNGVVLVADETWEWSMHQLDPQLRRRYEEWSAK
jgi:hypothetical protein